MPPVTGGLAVTFINNFPGPSLGGGEVQLLALLRGSAGRRRAGRRSCARRARRWSARRGLSRASTSSPSTSRFAPCRRSSPASPTGCRGGQHRPGHRLSDQSDRAAGRVASPHAGREHGARRPRRRAPGRAKRAARSRSARLSTGLTRRYVTRFVAVSQAVKAGLIADKVRASRITVIPNGVDLAQLRRDAAGELAVTLREASARVGFVGRLERIKGVEYFVRAAALPGRRPSRRALRRGRHGIPRGRAASARGATGHRRPRRVPRLRRLGRRPCSPRSTWWSSRRSRRPRG